MNISIISNRFCYLKAAVTTPKADSAGRVLISPGHQARATPETIDDICAVASSSIRNLRSCQPLFFFERRAGSFPTDQDGLERYLREHFAIMVAQDPFASLCYQSEAKRGRKYFEPEFIWLILSTIARFRGTLDPDRSHLTAIWKSKAVDDLSGIFVVLFSGHACPAEAGRAAFSNVWKGWSAYFSLDSRLKACTRKKNAGVQKRPREGEADEVAEFVGGGAIPPLPDNSLIPRS